MNIHSPFHQFGDDYVVRAPRASDAVGGALRKVFDAEPRLPADLAALLRRLDARRR